MASKYDPIWAHLKLAGSITLAIHPAVQKRVIKAVINLKDQDTARKFEMATRNYREKLTYKKEAAKVVITLTKYPTFDTINAGDL